MSVTRIKNNEFIRQTASDWVIKMDGAQLSEVEQKSFLAWLGEDDAHRAAFSELAELWWGADELVALSELIPLEDLSNSQQSPTENISTSKWSLFGRRSFAIAASFFVALVVGGLMTLETMSPKVLDSGNDLSYFTPIGVQQVVTLPDGSSVQMNTNTHINIRYTDEVRTIELGRGEAYFDVESDPARPFVVSVGNGKVRAVGTAFNIHHNQDTVDVIVTEGIVEVSSSLSQQALDMAASPSKAARPVFTKTSVGAGESVRFDDLIRSVENVEQKEIERRLSWQRGVLIFDGDRLEDVVEQITRYTEVKIVIDDTDIRDVLVGGYFQMGETEAMLDAFESSFDISVTRVNSTLVLLSKKINDA